MIVCASVAITDNRISAICAHSKKIVIVRKDAYKWVVCSISRIDMRAAEVGDNKLIHPDALSGDAIRFSGWAFWGWGGV